MKIIVCLRQAPSVESTIKPLPTPPFIDTASISYTMNPFDEFAVEEAVRIKERLGQGEVTCLTLGPQGARQILLNALAMGADKAIHIQEEAIPEDSYQVSYLLSEVIKGLSYDIILCGKEAIDDRQGAVGIELAEHLGLPHVAVITRLDIDPVGKRATAQRQIEGGKEVVECTLPAVFTCHKGLNEPRYPSLPGIMRAGKKPYQAVRGLARPEPRLSLKGIEALPPRKPGRRLEGEVTQVTEELIRLLREEAKVI